MRCVRVVSCDRSDLWKRLLRKTGVQPYEEDAAVVEVLADAPAELSHLDLQVRQDVR